MQAWCKIISWIIDVELEIRNKIEEGSWIRLTFSSKKDSYVEKPVQTWTAPSKSSSTDKRDERLRRPLRPSTLLLQPPPTSLSLLQPHTNAIPSLPMALQLIWMVAWAQRLGGVDPSSDCQRSTLCASSSQTRVACLRCFSLETAR